MFSFQLKSGGVENHETEVLLGEYHIYIGITLPSDEMKKIENQLLLGTIELRFSISLTFGQDISLFDFPKNNRVLVVIF